MVTLRLSLHPLPGKLPELFQTIATLAAEVRTQWGSLEFDYHIRDDGEAITVLQRWSDRAAADAYLRSREHRALMGAAGTLCRYHAFTII
jgi:quinol monooxygenase YgiN